jgi:hypothetical protein
MRPHQQACNEATPNRWRGCWQAGRPKQRGVTKHLKAQMECASGGREGKALRNDSVDE